MLVPPACPTAAKHQDLGGALSPALDGLSCAGGRAGLWLHRHLEGSASPFGGEQSPAQPRLSNSSLLPRQLSQGPAGEHTNFFCLRPASRVPVSPMDKHLMRHLADQFSEHWDGMLGMACTFKHEPCPEASPDTGIS